MKECFPHVRVHSQYTVSTIVVCSRVLACITKHCRKTIAIRNQDLWLWSWLFQGGLSTFSDCQGPWGKIAIFWNVEHQRWSIGYWTDLELTLNLIWHVGVNSRWSSDDSDDVEEDWKSPLCSEMSWALRDVPVAAPYRWSQGGDSHHVLLPTTTTEDVHFQSWTRRVWPVYANISVDWMLRSFLIAPCWSFI